MGGPAGAGAGPGVNAGFVVAIRLLNELPTAAELGTSGSPALPSCSSQPFSQSNSPPQLPADNRSFLAGLHCDTLRRQAFGLEHACTVAVTADLSRGTTSTGSLILDVLDGVAGRSVRGEQALASPTDEILIA